MFARLSSILKLANPKLRIIKNLRSQHTKILNEKMLTFVQALMKLYLTVEYYSIKVLNDGDPERFTPFSSKLILDN